MKYTRSTTVIKINQNYKEIVHVKYTLKQVTPTIYEIIHQDVISLAIGNLFKNLRKKNSIPGK